MIVNYIAGPFARWAIGVKLYDYIQGEFIKLNIVFGAQILVEDFQFY